jgi:hypothetical protein
MPAILERLVAFGIWLGMRRCHGYSDHFLDYASYLIQECFRSFFFL